MCAHAHGVRIAPRQPLLARVHSIESVDVEFDLRKERGSASAFCDECGKKGGVEGARRAYGRLVGRDEVRVPDDEKAEG